MNKNKSLKARNFGIFLAVVALIIMIFGYERIIEFSY